MLEGILEGCKCDSYSLYVSGGSNFRKEIDPQYKANRKLLKSPAHRQACHNHLVDKHGAIECINYEADDACGVNQRTDGSTMIVGIDKDLLQIPGLHYRWPILRKGVVTREEEFLEVDYITGMRSFFAQALTGDTSDNIIGIKGLGAVKASKLLKDCNTEEEMYDVVQFWYTSSLMTEEVGVGEQRLRNNLDLLWIWRELGVTYSIRREMHG